MSDTLCLSVRFLQPFCHARGERNEPQWPPAPLRLYQALVDAAAATGELEHAATALRWLERQPPPLIIAAPGQAASVGYRLYVPNNAGDRVAMARARGRNETIAQHRTDKDVRPTHLAGDATVHYVWPVTDDDNFARHREHMLAAARHITHLGWGIDMVAASASIIPASAVDALEGERWHLAGDDATLRLRVPIAGTLENLTARHQARLDRLLASEWDLGSVPPISALTEVGYARPGAPPRPVYAAFALRELTGPRLRPFDPIRHTITVTSMMRHAARCLPLGWPAERVATFVLGHGERPNTPYISARGPRLAFLPVPSIEPRGSGNETVGTIRRVLITVIGGRADGDLLRVAGQLGGLTLRAGVETPPLAWLAPIRGRDSVLHRYTDQASTWSTVSPVILPGHERRGRSTDELVRRAIRQAGFSPELTRCAEIDCRGMGYLAGVEMASRYRCPTHLDRYRRVHVRITWRDVAGRPIAIPGPICLGRGQYQGLGLFAAYRERRGRAEIPETAREMQMVM